MNVTIMFELLIDLPGSVLMIQHINPYISNTWVISNEKKKKLGIIRGILRVYLSYFNAFLVNHC